MSEGQPLEMNWPDQGQFMTELNKELANGSDRAIVLVCAAMVDELLRRLLTVVLPHTSNDLFEGSGAVLGSFSARITLVRALGLISEADHRRINILRRMRNDMAHRLSVTLSDESFDNRVREMWDGIKKNNIPDNPKMQFGAVGLYLIVMLSTRLTDVNRHRLIRAMFQ